MNSQLYHFRACFKNVRSDLFYQVLNWWLCYHKGLIFFSGKRFTLALIYLLESKAMLKFKQSYIHLLLFLRDASD